MSSFGHFKTIIKKIVIEEFSIIFVLLLNIILVNTTLFLSLPSFFSVICENILKIIETNESQKCSKVIQDLKKS